MGLTNFLLIFQREGPSLVRHRQTLLAISGETPATKYEISSLYFFKARTVLLSWLLRVYLAVDSSTFLVSLELGVEFLDLLWENFGFILSADFLPSFFSYPEAPLW